MSGIAFGGLTDLTVENYVKTESFSAFGEIYLTPIERLKITLGGRYTIDSRDFSANVAPNALLAFAPPGSPSSFSSHGKESVFTPRVVASYDFDAVNVYASWNRGYKEFGYNTPVFVSEDPVNAEKIDSFEVGAKFVSDDRRLRLNLAAFYYNYRDIQVSIIDISTGANVLENAAGAEGYGAEIDANFEPTNWLKLFGVAGYLHTEYTSYPNAAIAVIDPVTGGLVSSRADLTGTRLPRAPSFTGSVGFELHGPIGGGFDAHLNALTRYTSGYDFFPGAQGPLQYSRTGGYAIINLSGYIERELNGSGIRSYRLGFYINNATDLKYSSINVTSAGFGLFQTVAPPITYGLRASAEF
ncbi:hypothetical protein ATM17_30555 (plasmid) [Sphingopyxis macrogoltabida]|uniref:TonB-dependent receptor-like beta-barrel domain-containing protein n=1 Tax=Sphingopyxis macrogoltabida TaxID=33050 RepID=A0AAC9FHG9_SPHMC|nr:hypothetical protein ATM17_30555 [Sphingopyxis macrogoltabida]